MRTCFPGAKNIHFGHSSQRIPQLELRQHDDDHENPDDIREGIDQRIEIIGYGPTARRRMLSVAVYSGGADGMDLIVKALQRGNTHEVLQIGERLARQMERATSRERNALFRRIDKFLSSAGAAKDPDAAGVNLAAKHR